MKYLQHLLYLVLLLGLLACNPTPPQSVPPQGALGLLKVTITGITDGDSPTATAEWVQPNNGVSTQATRVVPVNGSNALNDVQIIRREVSFLDNDIASTRSVLATFDLVNRTLIKFDNFTLYAVHKEGLSLGGTGIVAMTSGTGASIADPSVARSFKPTHGMRRQLQGIEVNPNLADLQFFTPTELDNPTDGIKQQGIANGLLSVADTVLEYGFVARNFSGGRVINARNETTDCTNDSCKGTLTLAYQFPKVNPRQNNPFSFSLFFLVANETQTIGSQSAEEQSSNTVAGLTNFGSFAQTRTLAGSTIGQSDDRLNPMCRVKHAISPDLFVGPDPIPSASGSLDVCFGVAGKRITSFGSGGDFARSIAIQSDGKMVVAGDSQGSTSDFALARYNPSGSLDTGFGVVGKVTTDFASHRDLARSLALQGDGKIVVAGSVFNGLNDDFALARYNPNGSLDTGFGNGGKVTTDFASDSDLARAVAIQGDGKIVVVGSGTNSGDFALVRYNPSGSLDTSFGTGGKLTTDIATGVDQAIGVAIQGDGKIVIAGSARNASNLDYALVRYNPSGLLDTSFDGDGKLTVSFGVGNDTASALVVQPDGKILVAGSASNGTSDFFLVRFNPNGSLDLGFGVVGKVITDFASSQDSANALALQSDGKIVVAGISGNGFALARYNPNGSLDTSFGTGGKATITPASDFEFATSVAIHSGGKIVVAGSNGLDFVLAAYNR